MKTQLSPELKLPSEKKKEGMRTGWLIQLFYIPYLPPSRNQSKWHDTWQNNVEKVSKHLQEEYLKLFFLQAGHLFYFCFVKSHVIDFDSYLVDDKGCKLLKVCLEITSRKI